VRRIWKAHGLQPHRYCQFKLSTDPSFVAKLRDVVGLYVDPPAHAIVLSVDEKRRRLKRGVFRSVVDLQAPINRFLTETNNNPKPFTWTADPDRIIAPVRRGDQVLDPSTRSATRAWLLPGPQGTSGASLFSRAE
jgi:hypothetical protein